jgi:hypothetical protein
VIIQPTNKKLAFGHRLFILEEMPKNSICAEVGVFEGTFSQHIISITKPKKLHLVDPWIQPRYYTNIEHFEECDYELNQIRFENSSFPDEYFDWIYLDNGHKLLESYRQLKVAYKKVKSGGWIIGDDYREEQAQQVIAVKIFLITHAGKVEWLGARNWQFKIRRL